MVVVLAGSTGIGKSDVASLLCDRHGGFVVSADSVQAYAGAEIGANKPTREERRQTPHLLVDHVVATAGRPYNAAEWRRDALYVIRRLLYPEEELLHPEQQALSNREALESAIDEGRRIKGYADNQPVLPVVVGGTMMYVQWLVHGQPDAHCPTPDALERAALAMKEFEARDDWTGAVEHVLGQSDGEHANKAIASVLQRQVEKLSGKDWYRLRRILEVAYTAEDRQQVCDEHDSEGNEKQPSDPWEGVLYTGERSGGLESLGYDVRCFFLCPSDRMSHTRVVDERCEDMVRRGLMRETADLSSSSSSSSLPERDGQRLPDMVAKAIGYRQALKYLTRPDPRDNDEEAFGAFLDAFASATRRYSRKQMLWFRKDPTFVFIPVDLAQPKADRVEEASLAVDRMIRMPRRDYDLERVSEDSVSAQMRRATELQAKTMKTYQFQRRVLLPGTEALADTLRQADDFTRRIQSKPLCLITDPVSPSESS
jgi:tRNA dimethylallyltransferase